MGRHVMTIHITLNLNIIIWCWILAEEGRGGEFKNKENKVLDVWSLKSSLANKEKGERRQERERGEEKESGEKKKRKNKKEIFHWIGKTKN